MRRVSRCAAMLCVLLVLCGQTARADYGLGLQNYMVGDTHDLSLTLRDLYSNTGYQFDVNAWGSGDVQSMCDELSSTVKPGERARMLMLCYALDSNTAKLFTFDECALPLTAADVARVEGAFSKGNQTERERLYAGIGAMVNVIYQYGNYDTTARLDALLDKPETDAAWVMPALCALGGALLGSGTVLLIHKRKR